LATITLVTIIVSSIAWFSSNTQVEGNGLEISTNVDSNLVIAKTKEEIAAMAPPNLCFSVTFPAIDKKLSPARHDTVHSIDKYHPVGLEYVLNPEVVDENTGFSTKVLEYAPVQEDAIDGTYFYHDYHAFVAITNAPLSGGTMTATMDTTLSSLEDTYKACSIDYYIDGVYGGTTNLGNTTSAIIYTGTIPLNTEGCLDITLRTYFDGQLEKSEGQAYVYSADLNLERIPVHVSFSVE